ncbi:holo-ACP synthase [Candidatus Woesearchaeota archaeon]|nr:holo-ACP synthase [Candidatus Woesearchaeota archaeon]
MTGIGVDIESINRIKRLIEGNSFLNKVFTKNEINYCKKKANPAQHFAARFAAKEAVIKAVTFFIDTNLEYTEIEILKKENGAPFVNMKNNILKSNNILISLSHCGDLAVAFVLIK